MYYSPITAVSQDPTGWSDPTLVTQSYNSTSLVLTTSGTAKLYWQGRLVHDLALGNNLVSAAHTATNGAWYYYYNGSAYVWSQDPWTFDTAQIAYVNYVAATPTNSWALRECHSMMGWSTHQELHNTLGTYRSSGGAITAVVTGSTTASERRPAVSATVLMDEDLKTTCSALSAGTYTQFYVGASSAATFVTGAADIVPLNTAIPKWNNVTTGALTDLNANDYVNVWLVAMPTTSDAQSLAYRYLWVAGQAAGTLSVINAQTPASVSLGTLTSQSAEFLFISRFLIRYTSNDWNIVSVTQLYGTRYQQTGSAAAPVDLSGYAALSGAVFTGSVTEEAQHLDKHLTTITLPAAGYNSLIALSTGERRMKLPDGTELCDFVRMTPADFCAGTEFRCLSSSSTDASGLYGMTLTALSSGTNAHYAATGRSGTRGATSHASNANSGFQWIGDSNVGTTWATGSSAMRVCGFMPVIANISANLCGISTAFNLAGDIGGMTLRIRNGVVSGRADSAGGTVTTSTNYTITTLSVWYEAIAIKNADSYTFALLDASGIVLWSETLNGPAYLANGCSEGDSMWFDGTPSGATLIGYIDYTWVSSLAGHRQRTGVAALPYNASLITFY